MSVDHASAVAAPKTDPVFLNVKTGMTVIVADSDGAWRMADVLLQGERGRRQSQYLLWKSDPTGLITEKSRWLTDDQLAVDGYESVFGLDLNDNGTIGL